MNKLTKSEYTRLIAEIGDIDVNKAKNILEALSQYLYFRADTAETRKAFNEWCKNRNKLSE
jgi:hypothetical protein